MKCPSCGKVVPNKSFVCDYCGQKINLKPASVPKKKGVSKTNPSSPKTNTSKPTSKQTKSYEDIDLPSYHYWLLIPSIFFSITWIIPLVGLIATGFAYSEINETNEEKSDLDLTKPYILTIITGLVHILYLIAALTREMRL